MMDGSTKNGHSPFVSNDSIEKCEVLPWPFVRMDFVNGQLINFEADDDF